MEANLKMSSKAVKKQSRKAGKTKPGQRAAPIRDSNRDWIPACAGTSGVKHFDLLFSIDYLLFWFGIYNFRFSVYNCAVGIAQIGGVAEF